MKRVLFLSSLLAASFAPAAHALDVGVSIAISQPGVYGRVDSALSRLPCSTPSPS